MKPFFRGKLFIGKQGVSKETFYPCYWKFLVTTDNKTETLKKGLAVTGSKALAH